MGKRIQITESQLNYIIKNSGRIDEQSSQMKSKALADARTSGKVVIVQSYKSEEPTAVALDPLNGNFYANYTSLDLGLASPDLEKIKQEILGWKDYLSTNGYDLDNTTITLMGSASSEPATNRHSLPEHPKHNFGGKLPEVGWVPTGQDHVRVAGGNEFLAKSRASNIAKLVQQLIPGVKTKVTSKVETCKGESCRYIKASVVGSKTTKRKMSTPKIALSLLNNATYMTTNEWNQKHSTKNCKGSWQKERCGCKIQDGSDERVDGKVQSSNSGKRNLRVGSAPYGKATNVQVIGYDWIGDGFNSSVKLQKGGKTDIVEQSCAKYPGVMNISGKRTDLNGSDKVVTTLASSGYFSVENAEKVIGLMSKASPLNKSVDDGNPFTKMMRDGVNLSDGINIENWNKFIGYMKQAGLCSGAFDEDLALSNGAIIITPEGNVENWRG